MRKTNINLIYPVYIWLVVGLIVLVKLWLVSGQAISAREAAVHDDRLFLNLAQFILDGKWLGPYDQFTLIKGPFYSLWIAFSFIAGIPLLLSQHLLYIAACLVFCFAIHPLLSKPIYFLGLFGILVFNPMTYTDETMTRVIRDGIYPALTLLVFSCAAAILVRQGRESKIPWSWPAGLGIFMAAFWLTREEGIWLIPALVIMVIFSIYSSWKSTPKPRYWHKPFTMWGASIAIFIVFVSLVSLLNFKLYGVYAKTEFDAKPFKSAYGALARVKPDQTLTKVPVSQQTRVQIYKVSPTFSELEPFLEGELGQLWAELGEKDETNQEEILGGWFMWALRDAVSAAGYYSSGKFPAEYYNRLNREIDQACTEQKLDCFQDRATFFPPWRNEFIRPIFSYLLEGAKFFITFDGFNPLPSVTHGSIQNLRLFYDLTRSRLQNTGEILQVSGWAVSKDSIINIQIRNKQGDFVPSQIEVRPSPDVYEYLKDQGKASEYADEARFVLTTQCLKGCFLQFVSENKVKAHLALDQNTTGQQLQQESDFYYVIDDVTLITDQLPYQGWYDHRKIKLLRIIGDLYQFLSPIFFAASIPGYIYLSIRIFKKDILRIKWIILTCMLTAIGMRLLLIALISVTSWSAINTTYMASVDPFLLIFISLTLLWSMEDLIPRITTSSQFQTPREI